MPRMRHERSGRSCLASTRPEHDWWQEREEADENKLKKQDVRNNKYAEREREREEMEAQLVTAVLFTEYYCCVDCCPHTPHRQQRRRSEKRRGRKKLKLSWTNGRTCSRSEHFLHVLISIVP